MRSLKYLPQLFLSGFLIGCSDHQEIPDPDRFVQTDYVTGLASPVAIAKGPAGTLWVAEMGSGKGADGKVSVITPDGKTHLVATGFLSVSGPDGPAGLGHLIVKDQTLFILHGVEGKLYKIDISNFTPGKSAAIDASKIVGEPIGKFVKDFHFKVDLNESNLYNLAFGFDGDLFITDAAANAIIRRKPDGSLSVFHEFLPDSIPGGTPAIVDFVPTGIAFDGQKLLVTSFTGFPFAEGKSSIQQLDAKGNSTLYADNHTSLVDVCLTANKKPFVLQFAKFSLTTTPPGFAASSGKILGDAGEILDGINMPTDLEMMDRKTFFMTSLADGKIIKLSH